MARSTDLVTRRVRDGANAAALAVVAFAVLWFVTTQVHAIRDVSPFADDPWDLVTSFAALFLPLVAGATFVRSVAHRGPRLDTPVARRIAIGSGIAVAIVAVSVMTDIAAIVTSPERTGSGDPERGLIFWLVLVMAAITCLAAVFVVAALSRSAGRRRSTLGPDRSLTSSTTRWASRLTSASPAVSRTPSGRSSTARRSARGATAWRSAS